MMTPEEMQIAIAEKCGWRREGQRFTHPQVAGVAFFPPVFCEKQLPDYCNDLNAMREAEKVLGDKQYRYGEELFHLLGGSYGPDGEIESSDMIFNLLHASASQRAEAFCRVFWPERFN